MHIHLCCQQCEQKLRVSIEHRGKRVRCPRCGWVGPIPDQTTSGEATDGAVSEEDFKLRPASQSDVRTEAEKEQALGHHSSGRSVHPSTNTMTADIEMSDDDPTENSSADVEEYALGFKLELDIEECNAILVSGSWRGALRSENQIFQALRNQGIRHGIDRNKIKIACMYFEHPEQFEENARFVIAQGTPPTPGQDGQFVNELNLTGEAVIAEGGSDGARVDFKKMAQIQTVKPGQVLGRLIRPRPGRPGIGLDGRRVEPPPVERASTTIGHGVRMEPDGVTVVATIDGRPLIEDDHITVVEIYEIEGDVDYSTGNIHFDGHVVVKGLVLDDFEIRCKSLEVHGTVGSAMIRCENDATFHGGVNGHHRGQIVVGGTCVAKYLNEVMVRVETHLKVERGITNSDVGCMGDIQAERIVGGTCKAYEGIEAKDFGSDLGVTTRLFPGADYQRESLCESILHMKDELVLADKQLAAMGSQSIDLDEDSDPKITATKDARERRKALSEKLDLLETTLIALDESRPPPIAMANVLSQVNADVIVNIDGQSKEFSESRSGKWSITLDPETNQVNLVNYRRLRRTNHDSGPDSPI